MEVLLGSVESYAGGSIRRPGLNIDGVCTCPKCKVFPNLYEREEDGEKVYYAKCPQCNEACDDADYSIEDALDSWVSIAEDLARSLVVDVEDGIDCDLFDGYNVAIDFEYTSASGLKGKWVYTIQFEWMGEVISDPDEYSSPEEIKKFYEEYSLWLRKYFETSDGSLNVRENVMEWLRNLFKQKKAPIVVADQAKDKAPEAPAIPPGHVVAPIEWVRRPGEKEKLDQVKAFLAANRNDPTSGQMVRYLEAMLK